MDCPRILNNNVLEMNIELNFKVFLGFLAYVSVTPLGVPFLNLSSNLFPLLSLHDLEKEDSNNTYSVQIIYQEFPLFSLL